MLLALATPGVLLPKIKRGRVLALLGERTPIREQETIGSILMEDAALAPPVDAILCRKNVTAIWAVRRGTRGGTSTCDPDESGRDSRIR
ncbi:hypothetical protein [Paraburkholderia sp. RAU2J]|uniref:hypothetical protein n=1 Tax=Paraburkholderia sp. RAU2J TaxID=1938810 RepID=UPI001F547A97|nr:hypothetical protein [Paraburkholderia sp. RAU2J]